MFIYYFYKFISGNRTC